MNKYLATAATFDGVSAQATFTSIETAKSWARRHVTDNISVVISDAGFPSRYIKLDKLRGKNFWNGTAPTSWFSA